MLFPTKGNISKSGQGSIVAVILASVIGTILVGSLTQWYLSIDKNIGNQNTKLEASTVSLEEWNRLGHMSLEELRSQKETLKEPYPVGDYKVMVNLGEEGYFSDGKCGAVPSGRIANCFNDTTITVFNSDGERQFNSRQLPLQVGIYTKEEIDALLKDYDNKLAQMKSLYETRLKNLEDNMKNSSYQISLHCTNTDSWSSGATCAGPTSVSLTLPKGFPFTIWDGRKFYLSAPMYVPLYTSKTSYD